MSREIVISAVECGWIISCSDAHGQGSIVRQFAAETPARVIELVEELVVHNEGSNVVSDKRESRAVETERAKGGKI